MKLLQDAQSSGLAPDFGQVGVFETNYAKKTNFFNDRLKEILGKPQSFDPPIGYVVSRIHPEDLPQFQSAWGDMNTTRAIVVEGRLVREDGVEIWISYSLSATYDEKGRLSRAFGTIVDISNRRSAEQAIKQNEQRLARLMQVARVGIYEEIIGTGTIYMNPVLLEMLRLPSDYRAHDRDLSSRIHPDDLESQRLHIQKVLERGYGSNEVRVRREDGTYFFANHFDLIDRDETGKVSRIMGGVRDITAQKIEEERNRRIESSLKDLMEQTATGVFEINEVTETIQLSGVLLDLLGLPPVSRWVPNLVRDLVHPDDLAEFDRNNDLEASAKMLEMELRLRRADGGYFWAHIVGRLVGNGDSRDRGAYGTVRDITARKQAELDMASMREQEIAMAAGNRAKDSFFSYMTHELRTPLNAITNYATLIEEDLAGGGAVDPAVFEADIKNIVVAARHLRELVDGVLDLSKISAGLMELDRTTFSVFELMDEIQSIIQPAAARRSIDFAITQSIVTDGLHSDRLRVKQILLNLLANAVKFTERGHVSLAIENVGDRIAFKVTDTGIGMDADTLKRLFTEFHQADSKVAIKYGGTGLGLALSQQLARMMGGEITVTSSLGHGSTFTLFLPDAATGPTQSGV